MLPTPYISYLDHQQMLDSGGSVLDGDIMLKNIPANKFDESFLQGVSKIGKVRRFWVIAGPQLEPKAYTTIRVERPNPILFNVLITRAKSINSSDLRELLEEDDLNQQQVDDRIVALVNKGALKMSSQQDKSHLIFSKSFNVVLPQKNSSILFQRSSDGLTLESSIKLLTSPVGSVPNILPLAENGGPWGIRFDDAEFSTGQLERIIPPISADFPYDSGSHEYEKTLNIKGNTTALVEYVQVRETDRTRNGRFFFTWAVGSQGGGLSKAIKAVRVTVGNADPVDIPLSRDASVTNAFALKSDRLASDPTGLEGTGQVTMTFNFIFTDDTLAYGANGVEANLDPRDADLKYTWETWVGPSVSNLTLVAGVDRYHHDFETSSGFDIDMNTFNFMESLTGDKAVAGNSRRANSVNECRLKLQMTRHDKQQWTSGDYRVKVGGASTGAYMHDFQFKRGITT